MKSPSAAFAFKIGIFTIFDVFLKLDTLDESTSKTTTEYGNEPKIDISKLVPLSNPSELCPYNSSDLQGESYKK